MSVTELKLMALMNDDVEAWAEACALDGDVLPSDNTTLYYLFHKSRMRTRKVSMPKRVESRDILEKATIIGHEPVTVFERLQQNEHRRVYNLSVKRMLQLTDEVVLLFTKDHVRKRLFSKASEEMRGDLDIARSSITTWELYTVRDGHAQFILPHLEDCDFPSRTVYQVVNNVI